MFITAIMIQNQLCREISLNMANVIFISDLDQPITFVHQDEDGNRFNERGPGCLAVMTNGETILLNGTRHEIITRTA